MCEPIFARDLPLRPVIAMRSCGAACSHGHAGPHRHPWTCTMSDCMHDVQQACSAAPCTDKHLHHKRTMYRCLFSTCTHECTHSHGLASHAPRPSLPLQRPRPSSTAWQARAPRKPSGRPAPGCRPAHPAAPASWRLRPHPPSCSAPGALTAASGVRQGFWQGLQHAQCPVAWIAAQVARQSF